MLYKRMSGRLMVAKHIKHLRFIDEPVLVTAVQPFHERVPFSVLHVHEGATTVLESGRLDGSIQISELPCKVCLKPSLFHP